MAPCYSAHGVGTGSQAYCLGHRAEPRERPRPTASAHSTAACALPRSSSLAVGLFLGRVLRWGTVRGQLFLLQHCVCS